MLIVTESNVFTLLCNHTIHATVIPEKIWLMDYSWVDCGWSPLKWRVWRRHKRHESFIPKMLAVGRSIYSTFEFCWTIVSIFLSLTVCLWDMKSLNTIVNFLIETGDCVLILKHVDFPTTWSCLEHWFPNKNRSVFQQLGFALPKKSRCQGVLLRITCQQIQVFFQTSHIFTSSPQFYPAFPRVFPRFCPNPSPLPPPNAPNPRASKPFSATNSAAKALPRRDITARARAWTARVGKSNTECQYSNIYGGFLK